MATKAANQGYDGDWGLQPKLSVDPVLLDASVDGQGGTIKGKPVFTGDEAAFFLNRGDPINPDDLSQGYVPNSGAQWAGAAGGVNGLYDAASKTNGGVGPLTELTFGFYETRASLPEPYYYVENGVKYRLYPQGQGFSAFDADQRQATRDALQSWDDLIAISFRETTSANADLNYMNTTTGPIQASAYLPYNYSPAGVTSDGNVVEQTELAGDVFVNPKQASNHQFDEGQYGLTTLIHESGHALGLQHPGDYNFSADFDGTYETGAQYYQDSLQYTIMSYWGAEKTGAAAVDWNTLQFVNPATPLLHDILAIQRIYGADMTTRTGDTVYGFNSNAGRDAFDFTKTPLPIISIWDAGGNDTIDVSGFSTNSTINLNAGSFSSAGGSGVVPLEVLKARGILPATYTQAQYDALRAKYNSPDGLLHDNISIAYGVTIENAIGGSGNDTFIANEVANKIDGGAGVDTVSYQVSDHSVFVTLDNVPSTGVLGAIQSLLPDGLGGYAQGDTLLNIENVTGSNFGDQLIGNNVDNVLTGLDGNDILWANDGNDTLLGGNGNDVLIGGNGDDSLLGGAGNDLLNGGDGNDVLNGGAGDDNLSGGKGNDTFVFSEAGGNDVITDFQHGKDKIDLSDIDAITGNTGHDAFSFIGKDAFSGHAGELRGYTDHGDFFLAGDLNGDKIADFTIAINNSSVHVTDIIFV